MTVFLLYIISPVIVSFITTLYMQKYDKYNKEKYAIKELVICGIIMALMIGLRKYTNGSGDSGVYYNHWQLMSQQRFGDVFNVISQSSFEWGYTTIVFILSHVFKHPQFVFVFSGVFFSYSVCRFIYKNCRDYIIALVAFNSLELFIFMVQGLRQAIAMSICLFAIEKCKEKKFWLFLILVIIAMLFHASAVVFFIAYFLQFLELKWNHILMFIIVCLCSVFFIPYLFKFVNIFVRDEYSIVKDVDQSTGIIPILIYFVVLTAAFFVKPSSENTDNKQIIKEYSFMFYLTGIAFLTISMRNSVASITERISFFFAFGEIAIISNLISNLRVRNSRLIVKALAIILCFGVAIHKANYTSLVPYLFFWQ